MTTPPDAAIEAAARAIRMNAVGLPEDQERLGRFWDEGLTSPDDREVALRQARAAAEHLMPAPPAPARREDEK